MSFVTFVRSAGEGAGFVCGEFLFYYKADLVLNRV